MAKIGKILGWNRIGDTGFRFSFEKEIGANEVVYVAMPAVSANKRGINDIGWQSDTNITLYATLKRFLKEGDEDDALWTKVNDNANINKTVTYLKIVGGNEDGKVYVNVIMC